MAKKTTTKTTSKRTTKAATPRKPAAPRKPRVKDAAPAEVVALDKAQKIEAERPVEDVSGASPTGAGQTEDTAEGARVMGKRELVDRVVAASGIKKRAAKPVIEAMLKELGDALSRGETLNLQPFGKGIVKTRKNLENAEVVELRLRRSRLAMETAENPVVPPLAEAAE